MLLLDEITAALPADLSERVFEVVRLFARRGASVIFISHRMAEVARSATARRSCATASLSASRQRKGGEDTIVKLMLGSDVARATRRRRARAGRLETAMRSRRSK